MAIKFSPPAKALAKAADDLKRRGIDLEIPKEIAAEVEEVRRTSGSTRTSKKRRITLWLDTDIVEHFEKDGSGWQTRINDALRKIISS